MALGKTIYKKDCKVAIDVMALAILLAIPLGFLRTMYRFYNDLEQEFYQGAYQDGLSIQSDLEERMLLAQNLVTVARRYLDAEDPSIDQTLQARLDLENAQTPSEKYQANNRLTDATAILYETLGNAPLSEKDQDYRRSLYADLLSRNDTISHDPYNRLALEYNQKLDGFPAALLAQLLGVPKAEFFQ